MRDMVQVRRGQRKSYEGPDAKIGRSQFNRSHGLKMTYDASLLYPIFLDEILPGDTMTMKLNGFSRIFSPLLAPVMDNIQMETFFFFVPARLLWDNWENFNGAHDVKGAQDTTYTIPIIADGLTVDHDGGVDAQDLLAYFGVPDGLQTTEVEVNALPLRAYNLIYNAWFRDQNVMDDLAEPVSNGPDATSQYKIRRSSKKHDYFTSALPYLQKGSAQLVSISGILPVIHPGSTGNPIVVWNTGSAQLRDLDSGAADLVLDSTVGTLTEMLRVDVSSSQGLAGFSAATVDVNALRQSVAIQRLLERDARGGTRYVEIIKSHFGVTSPDFRLQRPEYLGGGKSMLNVSAVANTSGVDSTVSVSGNDEPQGELRGVGTGVISGHGWAKSFTEHGYIIGLIRARGDVTYFQGLDRLWSRSTRYDFYIPALANLGEQSILNKELFVSNVLATDNAVFGYQERWAEYRMKHSRVVGKFNPDSAGALSHWHLAEDFSSLPALNNTFIEDQTPLSRITTITTEPDFLLDVWFDYKCARPMPVYSIPSLTGRF